MLPGFVKQTLTQFISHRIGLGCNAMYERQDLKRTGERILIAARTVFAAKSFAPDHTGAIAWRAGVNSRPVSPLRSLGKLLLMIAAALLIVTVVGCMVGPNYRPSATTLPARWNGIDQQMQQAQNDGVKTDLATWWQSFDDPLLNAVIAQALASNLDEKIALARIREERAYVTISRAGLYPSIGTSGSYSRQRYSANTPFGFFPQLLPRDENIYEARATT